MPTNLGIWNEKRCRKEINSSDNEVQCATSNAFFEYRNYQKVVEALSAAERLLPSQKTLYFTLIEKRTTAVIWSVPHCGVGRFNIFIHNWTLFAFLCISSLILLHHWNSIWVHSSMRRSYCTAHAVHAGRKMLHQNLYQMFHFEQITNSQWHQATTTKMYTQRTPWVSTMSI